VPAATNVLIEVLLREKLINGRKALMNSQTKAGKIEFRIGRKLKRAQCRGKALPAGQSAA
jgi:hypothetical protein